MKLSIVIPAYDEAARLPATLDKVRTYLAGRAAWESEIIVVDDGSTDGTAELDLGEGATLLRNDGNRGKGHSVRRGMLAATGDLVLMTDADLSTPIEEVEKLMAVIDGGADGAIGSRGLAGSDVQVAQPFHRRVMEEPDFRAGNLSIRYLEEHPELAEAADSEEELVAAAIAAALLEDENRRHHAPRIGAASLPQMSPWRCSGWPWHAD